MSTIQSSERLLTLDEVAEDLGVDRMTVYYRLLSYEHLPDSEVSKQFTPACAPLVFFT
jgi:predicted DNA-binding transcriptional regulator AlpA